MKTVWIINQYASTPEVGMGGRSYYLAKSLAKKGFKVFLVASSANHLLREKKIVKGLFELEQCEGFTFVWVALPEYEGAHSKKRVLNWFRFCWYIQKLASVIAEKPDAILISSPSPVAFLGARRLARKYSARLVFEVRDIWPLTLTEIGNYSVNHPFVRFLQWVEDVAYKESDRVISNLKNADVHMIERGMLPGKFTWIPNGFSSAESDNPVPLDDYVVSAIPANAFLVGYTGTFGLANDLFTLVDAVGLLQSYSDMFLVLVGGGKDKKLISDYVANKDISNIIFVDAVKKNQVQSILELFDVLAVGAKKEPMYRFGVSPNKLFDYLAAGKPIVYHIESGDYHPVESARCGIEVKSGDPVALSNAILKLYCTSKSELLEMGANGRACAMEQYEYDRLAQTLSGVLFDV